MTVWLTPEWVEQARVMAGGLEGPATMAGTLQVDVTAMADGGATFHGTFAVGRLVSAGTGPADAPDAVVTLSDPDARSVMAGDLDPNVAFMQGRMKVAGDMGLVLDVLAMTATEAARACRARISAIVAG